jgi:hypothetical protein
MLYQLRKEPLQSCAVWDLVERNVRKNYGGELAIHNGRIVLSLSRVSAENPVRSQAPYVADADDRNVRLSLREFFRDNRGLRGYRIAIFDQQLDFRKLETGDFQVEVKLETLQLQELLAKQLFVPF